MRVAIAMVFFLPRHVIFGPLIFAWIGGAIGLSYATMNYFDLSNNRLNIGDSLPPTALGLMCGMFPGFAVMVLYHRCKRARPFIEMIGVTALFASVGAVFGSKPNHHEAIPPATLLKGVVFGEMLRRCRGDMPIGRQLENSQIVKQNAVRRGSPRLIRAKSHSHSKSVKQSTDHNLLTT